MFFLPKANLPIAYGQGRSLQRKEKHIHTSYTKS